MDYWETAGALQNGRCAWALELVLHLGDQFHSDLRLLITAAWPGYLLDHDGWSST